MLLIPGHEARLVKDKNSTTLHLVSNTFISPELTLKNQDVAANFLGTHDSSRISATKAPPPSFLVALPREKADPKLRDFLWSASEYIPTP